MKFVVAIYCMFDCGYFPLVGLIENLVAKHCKTKLSRGDDEPKMKAN